MNSTLKTTLSVTALGAVTATLAIAAAKVDLSKLPPAANREDVTYAKDIKPMLDASCIKCHGPEKQKARLRLDSLEAALKGGEDGKVILPGESAKSSLVLNAALLGDKDFWMPPPGKGDPLTAEQIGLIRAWIDAGAK